MTTKKQTAKKSAPKAKAKASTKSAPAKKPAAKTASSGKSVASATTASILGFSLQPTKSQTKKRSLTTFDHIKPEWVKYYQRLLDLRERLQDQMSGLAKESAEEMAGYSLHMADSGTDNFDRDFALGLLSADQDAMYEIEEALNRIENDTYGICEITEKPIPKARLNVIPWTRFTVQAQAQLERDGAVHQKRLGKLGSVGGSGGSVGGDSDDSDDDDDKPSKERK